MARGRMRTKTAQLEEAFTGRFTDHHAFLLRKMLARIDGITADIDDVEARIDEQIAPFAEAVTRLDEIPGIGRHRRAGHHRRDRPGSWSSGGRRVWILRGAMF